MTLRGVSPAPAKPAVNNESLPLCSPSSRLRVADVQIYRAGEELTQWLVYAMVIFSPWAFGTTQPWSIWVMNITGYSLGVLLAAKLAIRWGKGYRPPRWDIPGAGWHPAATALLAITTVAILAYILVSALNARATARFAGSTLTFDYHECISWLPHSLDSVATWNAFWIYLGLACAFWAVRDWLLGKSEDEQRAQWKRSGQPDRSDGALLPERFRCLLWLLAINGALLGLECIVQRLADSPKLLFLVQPRIHKTAETQFGPYAYRANAAQYFNLLWPVCLGFWWTLTRGSSFSSSSLSFSSSSSPPSSSSSSSPAPLKRTEGFLLLSAIILAACPIISTSRAGAFVALGIAGLAAFFLIATSFLLPGASRYCHRAGARLSQPQQTESKLRAGIALSLCTSTAAAAETAALRGGNVQMRSLLPMRTLKNGHAKGVVISSLVIFFATALALGLGLGWRALSPRLAQLNDGFENRQLMCEAALPMAQDYPVFGTGPGTFETVSYLYPRPDLYWPPQLHNDWLETRVTFGWFGSALIYFALALIVVRWFARGGIHGGRRFMILAWLALAGCLVHARYDFPFQVHSVLLLFLLLCAMLSTLSRRAV